MVALPSNLGRASASVFRSWRASYRSILAVGNRGLVPSARFSTISRDVDRFQHIHSHIPNEHQFMKFRMEAQPNDVDTNISDASSRNVKGLEKHLESRGIKTSTARMIFDYLRNKVIPSKDEFPFEFKEGLFEGTLLTLRRRYGDEIIFVKVKAVDEYKDPWKYCGIKDFCPEDYGSADSLQSLAHCLDKRDKCYLWDIVNEYYYERATVDEYGDEYGDEIEYNKEVREFGCLSMTINIFYGYHYRKRIKFDVFAFPDKIVVPETSLSDTSCDCLEAFDTYFKERGYVPQQMAEQEHYIKYEQVPEVVGRLNELQMKVTKCLADEKEEEGFTQGSFSKAHSKTGDPLNL